MMHELHRMDGWECLADEFGLLSAGKARIAGLTARDLRTLTKRGEIQHLARGWYALPSACTPIDVDTPAERRRRRHLLLTRAAVQTFEGRVAASHHSALVIHRLPVFATDLNTVHLMRVADDHSRSRRGLTVHQHVAGCGIHNGLVDPAVAVVQAGMVNGPMAALIAADAALNRRLIDIDDLNHAATLMGGPRIAPVRRLLAHADGRAESPGETRLRDAMRLMGFSTVPQAVVVDGSFTAVVDLLLTDASVVIEFDGFVKYGRTVSHPDELAPADVVVAEKLREDHLRELRYVVIRVTWSELSDLVALRRRIERAIALARLLPAA